METTGDLEPGTPLGAYRVAKKLGAGGMGAVYLAHGADGAPVALKVMHAGAAGNPSLRKRFVREGRSTQALDHPNVIRVLEMFEHRGAPVLAMEVLSGGSLEQHLEKKKVLPLEEAAAIFLRVTSALGAAHALGLVHRDVKPENIFLLDAAPFVKVLDFGIAKIQRGGGLEETSALTETGMLVGSPFYMSPEQAFGEKDIDHRSDIWAVGILLYRALTGTLVTQATTLKGIFEKLVRANFRRLDAVNPRIPADLAGLVDRMLRVNRDERPSDLREVYEVLSRHASALHDAPRSFAEAAPALAFDEPSDEGDDPRTRIAEGANAPHPRGTTSMTELGPSPRVNSVRKGATELISADDLSAAADGARTNVRPAAPIAAPAAGVPRRGEATVLIENPLPRPAPPSPASPPTTASPPTPAAPPTPASPPTPAAPPTEAIATTPLAATMTDTPALSSRAPRARARWPWIVVAVLIVGAAVFAITRAFG